MNLFLDTSALVKYFHEEEGSEVVTNFISSKENEIWLLELSRLEFISALVRKLRNGELNDEKFNEAIAGFEEELPRFHVEPLSHPVIIEAETLLKNYGRMKGLRTLDALHLGAFSLISEKDWCFVAADDILCATAQFMGFKTINPLVKNNANIIGEAPNNH